MSDQKPIRIGTVTTIDTATGEVVDVKEGAFGLLPAPPGVCPECAQPHAPEKPHNKQSLRYQFTFKAKHGRWPTWTDAMAHCTPQMQALWRGQLIELLTQRGLPVPEDLAARKESP